MASDIWITGIGATTTSRKPEATVSSMAQESIRAAIEDAGASASVEAVFFSNSFEGTLAGQESIRGQVALQGSPWAGLPLFNIENACASGSSALMLARSAVLSGAYESVAVVASEKLSHEDRSRPIRALLGAADVTQSLADDGSVSYFMQYYARKARHRMDENGWTVDDFAAIAVKNRRHAHLNPGAQFRDLITVDDVLGSRCVTEPLTLLMCSPVSDSAATIIISRNRPPSGTAVRIIGAGAASQGPVQGSTTRRAADRAYADAGVAPADIDLAEVHDASAYSELEEYESLGWSAAGEAPRLVHDGTTAIGGSMPVNTSGGLLSRGHPIGATGALQIVELTTQLRGKAGARQVEGSPRLALAQNAGGMLNDDSASAVVTILERA